MASQFITSYIPPRPCLSIPITTLHIISNILSNSSYESIYIPRTSVTWVSTITFRVTAITAIACWLWWWLRRLGIIFSLSIVHFVKLGGPARFFELRLVIGVSTYGRQKRRFRIGEGKQSVWRTITGINSQSRSNFLKLG
jgi:hypothetical protein